MTTRLVERSDDAWSTTQVDLLGRQATPVLVGTQDSQAIAENPAGVSS